MVRPAGLLGAARLALRVALKGDRRHCVASSNPIFYVVGSTPSQIGTEWRSIIFCENGAPGGITRRCAPRPSGRPKGRSPPLRGVVEPDFLCRGFDPVANRHRMALDNFL